MDHKITTVQEYISQFSPEIQKTLNELTDVITGAVPGVKQGIKWNMPSFYLQYNLFHFAVQKNHIGLHCGGDALIFFSEELKDYTTTKGTFHLPLGAPVPRDLITRMVQYNAKHK